MTRMLGTVAATALILMQAACGGGGSGSDGGTDAATPAAATLSQVADCDELHAAIRADARRKVEVQADQLRANAPYYVNPPYPGSPTPQALATPAAPLPTAAGGPDDGAPPPATDTNTQVPGVDEADVVETDGAHVYLLRGNELLILTSFPPEATALTERVTIEGYPFGMFVADGRALVLSSVYDTGLLGGNPRCGQIGPPFPMDDAHFGSPPFTPYCTATFVKLTLLDLGTAPARTVRELYVEGGYVAARRHGGRVRLVVQRDWGLPVGFPGSWESIWGGSSPRDPDDLVARIDAWERGALAAIDSSTLADWLPAERERVDGALVDHALTCDHARVPPIAQADQGTTLIVGLDMTTDDSALEDTLLFGNASQVYANGETLVLAYPEWQAQPMGDASSRTALHVFTLPADSFTTVYRGSGFISGTLLSQFAVDVKDDVLRVATSFVSSTSGQSVSRVTTARTEDEQLVTLGQTGDLAPGEQMFAARFLGDRAYLVTFVRIDPLFVVDLSDPAHPAVLGEVELPGFSEYLHPLDADHLLTVGVAADQQGRTLGGALRIFDVGDPTAPRLTHEHLLPNDSWTPVSTNHLAFTFDTRLGLLALPVNRYSYTAGTIGSLQIVAVDATDGFTLRGAIEHGTSTPPCQPQFEWEVCPYGGATMERGLFIGDAVYSISTAALQVHALDDLVDPLATVGLSQ